MDILKEGAWITAARTARIDLNRRPAASLKSFRCTVTYAKIYGPYGSHNAHLGTQGLSPPRAAKRVAELYRESFLRSTEHCSMHEPEATLL